MSVIPAKAGIQSPVSRCLLWLVAFLYGSLPAFAIHVWNIDIQRMSVESRQVVFGNVVRTTAFYDDDRDQVLTEVELAIQETVKSEGGAPPAGRFVIPGGTYNGAEWAGPGLPKLQIGQKVMVFLEQLDGRYWPYGLPLGIFYQQASAAGVSRLTRDLSDAHVVDLKKDGVEVKTVPTYYEFEGFKRRIKEFAGVEVRSAPPSLEELHRQADAVLTGRVKSVEVLASPDRLVITRVEISPYEQYKGTARETWRLDMDGGKLPEIEYEVYDAPGFSANEDVLIFLKETPAGPLPVSRFGKVAGRRKADGGFELLLPDGVRKLDDLEFLK
ncbi:hypothetical protein HY522_01260 [bacterium]|nr:hypothetical protein [bacterium]